MPALRAALAAPLTAVPRACLQPRFEQLALFAAAYPSGGLAGALRMFAKAATLGAHYFFGDVEPLVRRAPVRHAARSLLGGPGSSGRWFPESPARCWKELSRAPAG